MGRNALRRHLCGVALLKGDLAVAKLQQSPGFSPDARGLEGDEKPP